MDVQPPPAIYDHDYLGKRQVILGPFLEIDGYCRNAMQARANSRILACSQMIGDTCVVVLPKVDNLYVDLAFQVQIRRHEYAHCNGWPANHSQ